MDNLGSVAGLDDDDLKDLAEGTPAIGVYLPDAEADQGAQERVEAGVCKGGGDREGR